MEKERFTRNGKNYTLVSWSDNLRDKLRQEVASFLEKMFFITEEIQGPEITVTRVSENDYKYDIKYGEMNVPFKLIADYQEIVKERLDYKRIEDPNKTQERIKLTFGESSLDLLGFKRIGRYLTK